LIWQLNSLLLALMHHFRLPLFLRKDTLHSGAMEWDELKVDTPEEAVPVHLKIEKNKA
jgi:hypothetical protein